MNQQNEIRPSAEVRYGEELKQLASHDKYDKPVN